MIRRLSVCHGGW